MIQKKWVKNRKIFELSKLRNDALGILEAGLSAVDTKEVLKEEIRLDKPNRFLKISNINIDLSEFDNVYFVAIGKCAADAGRAIEEILGGEITDGIVLDIRTVDLKILKMRQGTHPMPSEENVSATEEIV